MTIKYKGQSYSTVVPENGRIALKSEGAAMTMHPRPIPSSDVALVRNCRKLRDPLDASGHDLRDVMQMLRGGDLRHIDEACEAFSAADYREDCHPFELVDGLPCEIAFRVHEEQQEELRADWHNSTWAHDVTVRSVTVAAIRMGDWHGARDDLIAMIGDERVRRIEEMQTEATQ